VTRTTCMRVVLILKFIGPQPKSLTDTRMRVAGPMRVYGFPK